MQVSIMFYTLFSFLFDKFENSLSREITI